jgi:hypothetical protein
MKRLLQKNRFFFRGLNAYPETENRFQGVYRKGQRFNKKKGFGGRIDNRTFILKNEVK